MRTIKILLVLFCMLPILVWSQTSKQIWTKAELVGPEGQTIHKWNAESFTQFITQRVCKKRFLIISSNDTKVLQMLSPSSVFDVSPIRSFEQVGEMKSADRDSINVVYKFNFKSLNYPDGVILFTDSTTSFVMLMSSKNVALVLHNNSR
jgi:hypothetical protein